MSYGVTAEQLRSYIERLERLEEEKKNVAEDIKEVFAEAKGNGFDTKTMKVHVFEFLTTDKETHFIGKVKDLEGKQFSDLSVIVFDQTKLESYINFK